MRYGETGWHGPASLSSEREPVPWPGSTAVTSRFSRPLWDRWVLCLLTSADRRPQLETFFRKNRRG